MRTSSDPGASIAQVTAATAAASAPDEREKRRALEREAREAQRAQERAEQQVEACEARVAELTKELEAPGLYESPNGAQKAKMLGSQLEKARRELDAAVAAWERATEVVEAAR